MDFGFYQLKNPFRRFIFFLLPYIKWIHPNVMSLMLVPWTLVIVFFYYWGKVYPWMWLLAIVAIFVRMIIATLDGLMAEEWKMKSPLGDILNRLTPELSDLILLASLSLILPMPTWVIVLFLTIAWLSSYLGLVGLLADKPILSMGPVGQTDRLVALMLASLAAFFWGQIALEIFVWWCLVGGAITVVNRLRYLL